MSTTVIVASTILFLVGMMFGCMPLVGAFRLLPRWIRIALHIAGIAFVSAGLVYVALDAAGPRVSPQLHRLIFAHIVLIGGMGLGILFLLAVSGEYMKALRDLSRNQGRDHPHV
jgi:uncharacterized membrane protein YidH (DUF202 family)